MTEDRFTELMTKKLAGEITPQEEQELKELLSGSAEYTRLFTVLKEYWATNTEEYANGSLMLNKIKRRIEAAEPVEVDDKPVQSEAGLYRSFPFWRNIAACVAGILFIFWAYSHFSAKSETRPVADDLRVITTPSKTKSKVTLSDGTIVNLNSESELTVPASFKGPLREVYLKGEAFFEVTKDPNHPFIVHADKMSIRVLGTAFNVKAYPNDNSSETTLLQGAIELTLTDRPSDRIILKPNEKLVLKNNGKKETGHSGKTAPSVIRDTAGSSKYSLTNLTYYKSDDSTIVETSWTANKLVFKNESFELLALQMERWYGVQIRFENDRVRDFEFTGIFEKESLSQALYALQLIGHFQFRLKDNQVTIF